MMQKILIQEVILDHPVVEGEVDVDVPRETVTLQMQARTSKS